MKRLTGVLLVVLTVLGLSACDPLAFAVFDSGSNPPDYQTQFINQQDADVYGYTTGNGQTIVSGASENTGGSTRQVFWPSAAPESADGMTCALWRSDDGGVIQEGAALRIHDDAGVWRGVTVTKNIWLGANWIFNFHVWDSSQTPVFTQIGAVDLSGTMQDPATGLAKPLPWHFCARVIGTQLSFKVWIDGDPTPRWDDTTHGGTVTLPDRFVYAGKAGWYIGHLYAGQNAVFEALQTFRLDP